MKSKASANVLIVIGLGVWSSFIWQARIENLPKLVTLIRSSFDNKKATELLDRPGVELIVFKDNTVLDREASTAALPGRLEISIDESPSTQDLYFDSYQLAINNSYPYSLTINMTIELSASCAEGLSLNFVLGPFYSLEIQRLSKSIKYFGVIELAAKSTKNFLILDPLRECNESQKSAKLSAKIDWNT